MKKLINIGIMGLLVAFSSSSCMEHRYYQKNHEHSKRYNDRHYRSDHPGINIDVHHDK